MKKVINYFSDEYWNELGDPRVKDWPFINGGLWRILAFVSIYLAITMVALPRYMKNRPAYKLRNTILVYNTFMVICNFYFFCVTLAHIDYGRIFFEVNYPSRNDRSPDTMWFLEFVWFGYLTRLIDLLDTVFFVLRKNERQLTVLHVYHHSVVPILGFIIFKFNAMIPGMRLFILLNTFIHSIMNIYYFLSALGPSFRKFLWWKKYITILQLVQFAIYGVYLAIGIPHFKGYPQDMFPPIAVQPPLFFLLYYNFYRQTYKKSKQKSK